MQWQIQDFQDEGRQPRSGDHQPIVLAISPKNCMILRQIRLGAPGTLAPPWIRQ